MESRRTHPLVQKPDFPNRQRRRLLAYIAAALPVLHITPPLAAARRGLQPFDPRIHFALNCASRSCPPIAVYDASHIDAQLDLAARSFVDADVVTDAENNEVRISSIFKWYHRDFRDRTGVISFLLDYLPDDHRRSWLEQHAESVRLVFTPYDWSLNT